MVMKEMTCDVLVVGGGGSGLVAAVRAAEVSGKRVVVMEKAKAPGGGMQFACSMRIFRSKWQKERNIEDKTAEYIRSMMDHTYWRLDHDLVRDAIVGTGEFFDWYYEHETEENRAKYEPKKYIFDLGDVNAQISPQYDNFRNGSGALVMNAMKRACEKLGIAILTQHRAVDVELSNGKVSAVIAESNDGAVRIRCKQVILSCSSWIRNKEVMKKILPDYLEAEVGPSPHENPAYTGDGIPIAEKAGAKIDYDSFCLRLMGPICGAAKNVLDNYGNVKKVDFDSLTKDGCLVMVDLNGVRFAAETTTPRMDMFDSGQVLLKHPKGKVYFIYSADTIQEIIRRSRLPQRDDVPDFMTTPPLPDIAEINTWFENANANEWSEAAMADTVEALALRIGIDPAVLSRTIQEYNADCAEGEDSRCFKDPTDMIALQNGPFYAISGKLATDGAFGGVEVDRNMRAYRADRSVIDNFYVTGDFASGRHIVLGGVKRQVLNDMSWAFSSGFIAGTRAGEALKDE